MKLVNCNQSEIILYQVQKEDTLNTILSKFSITSNNIVRNNPNIDLYEGEIIKIINKSRIQHIVKPMETLNSIATKYNIDEEILVKLNKLNSKRLFVGQTLIIDGNNS
ncbi:MAG: LysM peptidoglycan-binding domain-containing protein [Clostridia bacterium]|nr:LysM peptidoglycan-binding domain-containing protein [Clostridia bacterium]